MGVHVLTEEDDDRGSTSVFICSTSGTAFGPLMSGDKEDVYGFQAWTREVKFLQDERITEEAELRGYWYEWSEMSYEDKQPFIEKAY